MYLKIIDGKALAGKREQKLKEQVEQLNFRPKVVSILIGDDPPSILYTQMKQKKAQELGIDFDPLHLPQDTPIEEVLELIKQFNINPKVHGIMIQLPLPKEFLKEHDKNELLNLIDQNKDVDGLREGSSFMTAAVKAVFIIIEEENIEIKDKNCVVVGVSDLLGKPIAKELENLGGIVSVANKSTGNLKELTLKADILISATGVPHLIKADMVKEGVVIIDLGVMIVDEPAPTIDGKVVGDVDFENVLPKASKITPVPGGVGPLTVISLMENTVKAAKNKL